MELDAWIGLCSRYNMDTGDTINLMLNKSEWVLINLILNLYTYQRNDSVMSPIRDAFPFNAYCFLPTCIMITLTNHTDRLLKNSISACGWYKDWIRGIGDTAKHTYLFIYDTYPSCQSQIDGCFEVSPIPYLLINQY